MHNKSSEFKGLVLYTHIDFCYVKVVWQYRLECHILVVLDKGKIFYANPNPTHLINV